MPKKTDAGNPEDWLGFVDADLEAVDLLAENRRAYHVCHSKLAEALEKSLKADLIFRGWRLIRIHDLQKLCDYLADYDQQRALDLQSLVDELAESYTINRYPGFDTDDPDWEKLDELRQKVHDYKQLLVEEIKTVASTDTESTAEPGVISPPNRDSGPGRNR